VFVGVLRVVLQIPGSRSLKDKRRVTRSFKDRLRSRLPVSVAEVGDVESWQTATLGVAAVSGDSRRCDELLDAVVSAASSLRDALVADVRREVLSFGHGGSALGGGIEDLLSPAEER
jgi:uncharacterized protein YlxP (DUF503 family)